jgi:hypothetical protein
MCLYFILKKLSKFVCVKQNNLPILLKFENYILSFFSLQK